MNSIKHWTDFSKKYSDIGNGVAIFFIKAYQATIGTLLGPSCRFYPSCSCYAIDAYKNHSFIAATQFVIMRICRCHPLGPYGYDPIPEKVKKNEK